MKLYFGSQHFIWFLFILKFKMAANPNILSCWLRLKKKCSETAHVTKLLVKECFYHCWNTDTHVKIFWNDSSLRPMNDLTTNFAELFLGWFFTKSIFLCWSEIQYGLVLTWDSLGIWQDIIFPQILVIKLEQYMKSHWMIFYKICIFYVYQKSKLVYTTGHCLTVAIWIRKKYQPAWTETVHVSPDEDYIDSNELAL